MGCKFSNNEFESTGDCTEKSIGCSNFKMLKLIGRGGFSKVWKVEKKKGKQIMAMKIMSKIKVIEKNCIAGINGELQILARADHPFIIQIHYAFQDNENLYLVMDYYKGGDLRHHLINKDKFTEEQISNITYIILEFIISCLILALEYLHCNSIIHRDVKPENLIIDENGYVCLTDLGVAKEIEKGREVIDSSGTPGYMAPEVINHNFHNQVADYYALGVIMYEMILKKRPYKSKTRKDLRCEMLAKEAKITTDLIPEGMSLESADFTNKLLKRKPCERLGANGFKEIKNHPWLKDVDWKKLYAKELEAPLKPDKLINFDVTIDKHLPEENEFQILLEMLNKNQTFADFFFIRNENFKSKLKKLKNPHFEGFSNSITPDINLNNQVKFRVIRKNQNIFNLFNKNTSYNIINPSDSVFLHKSNIDISSCNFVREPPSEDLNNISKLSLNIINNNIFGLMKRDLDLNLNKDNSFSYVKIKRKNKNSENGGTNNAELNLLNDENS